MVLAIERGVKAIAAADAADGERTFTDSPGRQNKAGLGGPVGGAPQKTTRHRQAHRGGSTTARRTAAKDGLIRRSAGAGEVISLTGFYSVLAVQVM
jgi:hypothetical protein